MLLRDVKFLDHFRDLSLSVVIKINQNFSLNPADFPFERRPEFIGDL